MIEQDRAVDAIIVDAGFAGMRGIFRLRSMGLDVRAFEAARDGGGTAWRNRCTGPLRMGWPGGYPSYAERYAEIALTGYSSLELAA